ncbi:T9SS type A sorting domain-containing protein [Chryseobacterium sp. MYb264]|uniref:T9SS type A sorting domain-containing protein n=1 Tax=Chryseobacterium sp. MYb264 TaxID=2745153 RepID=UPI002E156B05|nr:T9SS type A sorting domain-containing protein [Chryseobacterium sp. MYb264]
MKYLYLFGLAFGSLAFGQQTITFNGCHELFDDQNFVFNKTGVDSFNKNIYITTPVTGDQNCGGLGTCEFKIQWNNSQNRWEFLADEGNGTFANPNLIYYNSTGNAAAANPPSNTFGTWVENTVITEGECGGNLNAVNSTMTGDVHSTFLGTTETVKTQIQIFPNPVAEVITISGINNAQSVLIYNMAGQLVKNETFDKKLNVSELTSGVYLLRIKTKDSQTHEFKFVKK